MGIIAVTYYRGECDREGCKADPMEHGEYAAWGEADQVITDAQEGDWYTATGPENLQILMCPDHAPKCDCPGCEACKTYPDGNCKISLRDDEFGARCEDCHLEMVDS